ncbi:cytochrome b/b6 domain-containing protein [Candidatus Sumerlaeota bacterium]|nr:cytochrome b/b6 domain-containing protein [Candidatus Sumerlaeota bacterium]
MATAPTIPSHPMDDHELVFVRLNKHERAQHVLFFVSFLLLAVTGFTLRLPEDWMRRLGEIGMGYEARSLVHRAAGIVMILVSLAHIYYVLFIREGREWLRDIFLRPSDIGEGFRNVQFYLGLRRDPPRFGRFNYKEKMEYWALFVGNTLMSITGLMMMFEYLWPQLALDIAALVHRMEAILACLAIIVWHMYEVHLRPGRFPHSLVWFHGLMDEEEMEEEHPAHLEELKRRGGSRVLRIHRERPEGGDHE